MDAPVPTPDAGWPAQPALTGDDTFLQRIRDDVSRLLEVVAALEDPRGLRYVARREGLRRKLSRVSADCEILRLALEKGRMGMRGTSHALLAARADDDAVVLTARVNARQRFIVSDLQAKVIGGTVVVDIECQSGDTVTLRIASNRVRQLVNLLTTILRDER